MTQKTSAILSGYPAAGSDIKNLFQLFIKAPFGMAICSGPSLTLEFANDHNLDTWSKTRDEVVGRPFFEVFPQLAATRFEAVARNVFNTGKSFKGKEFEISYFQNEKLKTLYFDFLFEPMRDFNGTVSGLMMISNETTDEVLNRKKIEESELLLLKTKEQLELSISAGRIGIWHWDVKNDLRSWSKEQLEIYGVSPGEFSGKAGDFLDRILPEDRKKMNMALELEMQQPESQYEFRIRRKNGEVRWIQSRSRTFFDKNRHPDYITGVNIDITQLKLAEAKIVEGEKKYRQLSISLEEQVRERIKELDNQNKLLQKQNELIKSIIDSSIDLIAVYDADTRIVTMNQAARRVFGNENDDVAGQKLLEAFPQFENSKSYQDLLRALNGETVRNAIYQSPVDGKYYENYFLPLSADDRIYAVLAIAHDNTELINKNKELNEAQQIAQLGSWEWNMGRNEVLWSDEMYRIYGYGEERFPLTIEKALEPMQPGDAEKVIERVKNWVNEALSNFKSTGALIFNNQPLEYSIFLPGGEKKILKGMGKIILSPDGSVSRIVGTVQDITENAKQLEELRRLNEADKLKSDFIKMASHELKTPITSIKGYTELLLTALKEEKAVSPLLVKSSLVSIDKQITRLTRLLSELLDLAKIETGKFELNKTVFSLNELVIDTVQDILYTNTKHSINVFHDLGCQVFADRDRVEQVLINFLTNAIKYSPNSDKIDVWVQRAENNLASVSVKDYGIGIDARYHQKIFDRFYRAQGKEEQTYPGFGIGLFIAKEIIQQHQGSIRLVSEKGKGSVFSFQLPIASSIKTKENE